jgi:hypothetical protein
MGKVYDTTPLSRSDHEGFIIESALHHGFTIVDDDATVFQCTEQALIDLVNAYMQRSPGEPCLSKAWVALENYLIEYRNARKLRSALASLVGEDDVETLKQMLEYTEERAPAGTDKTAMLIALRALIEVRS